MNQLSSKLPLYHPLILFLFFLGFWMRTSDGLTEYQEYVNCSPPYSCGNLYFNFTYPFQLDDKPDYCGRPGISLSCINHNSTLLINISGKSYHVKDMDYTNQVLTIVDQAFVGQSCPQIYTNTTFDSSIFEYTDLDSNLSLYFNCTFPTPKLQEINCLQSVDGRRSYYMIEDGDSSPINMSGNCSSTAIIPVHKTVVDKLVSGHKSLGDALQEGFSVKWTDGSDECCRYCMDTGGVCGYNSSSLYSTCFYQNMTDPYCFWRNQDSFNFWLTIIIVVAIFLLVCTWFAICLRCNSKFRNSFIFWMKKSRSVATVEAILKTCGSLGPKRFKYSEVKKMTKSFNDKLGQGGFGTVFKGMLPDGHQVAVKVLSDSKGNGEEFVNEVASIGKTSHVNIVSLLGFCSEGSKRALIFDFMPNGSLEKFIYIKNPKTVTLGWQKLYEIAIGIARGLEYLHRGCKTRIVHFDIKPHNIQLDQDFCPKISDFGLAKLCSRKESIVSMQGARGTVGYIAPEVCSRSFGVVSSKSDVYSYGMMILEMVGGRKNVDVEVEKSSEIYFPHWVYEHLDRDGYLDACGVTTETEEIAKKMILVGLWCIQTIPGNRPSMSRVVEMFEGSIRDLQMPPKPNLYSPSEPEIARSAASMS